MTSTITIDSRTPLQPPSVAPSRALTIEELRERAILTALINLQAALVQVEEALQPAVVINAAVTLDIGAGAGALADDASDPYNIVERQQQQPQRRNIDASEPLDIGEYPTDHRGNILGWHRS